MTIISVGISLSRTGPVQAQSPDMRKDRIVLFIATGSLVAATGLVVANAAFPLSQPSGVTKCSVEYHGTKIEKVKCAQ